MTVDDAVRATTTEDAPRPGDVQEIEVDATTRSRGTLERVDYADSFLAGTASGSERTAEQWARAMLEAAPSPTRRALTAGWTALGLRVRSRGDRDHILGWTILQRSADRVLLGADGRLGLSGQLLFERTPGALLFATFVRLDNPAARATWPTVIPSHRRTVQRLLESITASAVDREPAPST